jgi:hypothetical protein
MLDDRWVFFQLLLQQFQRSLEILISKRVCIVWVTEKPALLVMKRSELLW